jgi:hypothetical protein
MQFFKAALVWIRPVVLNHVSEQLNFTEKQLKTKLATLNWFAEQMICSRKQNK